MESLLIQDIIRTIIMATTVLIAVSFSLWYSSKLSLFKIISFKYCFYASLVALVSMGAFRTVLKSIYPNMKGLTPILFSILFGLIVETVVVKLLFKESFVKSLITVFFSFIVSIIIIIPIIVSAGFLMAYLVPPTK